MDVVIYDQFGNFSSICRNGSIFYGPGSSLWDDYVAQNGVPPAAGTPTFKPARIPVPYTQTYNYLKTLTQAQQLQVLGSVCAFILVQNPQLGAAINAAFSLSIPYDQVNP